MKQINIRQKKKDILLQSCYIFCQPVKVRRRGMRTCIHHHILNVLTVAATYRFTSLTRQLCNKFNLFFSACSDAEGIFGTWQIVHYCSDGIWFYLPFLELRCSPSLRSSSPVLRNASFDLRSASLSF